MKEGIHPNYREVCFVDLSNGFKFVTRSCAADARKPIKMEDGRELPLMKLETTSETHPFYTGTQKSVDSLGGRVEKFRNKFARVGTEEVMALRRHRRSERAASAALFVWPAHRGMIAPDAVTLNTPNPALVTQRAAQRLPRLALLLFCAAYVLPGVFGRDPWRNADLTAFGQMLAHRRRPHALAGARRSAACRPTRRCCRTGSAPPPSGCCRRWSTRRSPPACPSRCCWR